MALERKPAGRIYDPEERIAELKNEIRRLRGILSESNRGSGTCMCCGSGHDYHTEECTWCNDGEGCDEECLLKMDFVNSIGIFFAVPLLIRRSLSLLVINVKCVECV